MMYLILFDRHEVVCSFRSYIDAISFVSNIDGERRSRYAVVKLIAAGSLL